MNVPTRHLLALTPEQLGGDATWDDVQRFSSACMVLLTSLPLDVPWATGEADAIEAVWNGGDWLAACERLEGVR